MRATSRLSSPAWFAQPNHTSSISAAATPARSTAALIAIPARSSGRTAASAPSRRPTGVRTALRMTALGIRRIDGRAGPAEELRDRTTAAVAVVRRQLVHVHRYEAVCGLAIDAAAEALCIRERLVAVLEADSNRFAEHLRHVAQTFEIA